MAARSRAQTLISKPFLSSLLAPRSSILRHRPLAAALSGGDLLSAAGAGAAGPRRFSSRPSESYMRDSAPNRSDRSQEEKVLLDGCDFEHWLVVMDPPEGNPSREQIIDSYIKTFAQIVGSDDEARMKIYSVSTRHYFAFGALISEERSAELKKLPGVRWVLPDSYMDVRNKDYGGEPFINGQAVPYDLKYHEEWVRNHSRANNPRNNPRNKRNFDRGQNFERRFDNMQNRELAYNAPPPFAQNPGQSVTSHCTPNAQTSPNLAPSRNPGDGPSPNQGREPPPNNNMPNRGFPNTSNRSSEFQFQNQRMPPSNNSFQNPPEAMGGPNYQNHGNAGYPNQDMRRGPNASFENQGARHGGYQNQGAYPTGYQNRGSFSNQGNYQRPEPHQNHSAGGPNSGIQNSYAPNRDMGGYRGQQVSPGAAPTMPVRDY